MRQRFGHRSRNPLVTTRTTTATRQRTTNLVALGSAAVLAIYSAGYARTREAAQRFSDESAVRRPVYRAPSATDGMQAGGSNGDTNAVRGAAAPDPAVASSSAAVPVVVPPAAAAPATAAAPPGPISAPKLARDSSTTASDTRRATAPAVASSVGTSAKTSSITPASVSVADSLAVRTTAAPVEPIVPVAVTAPAVVAAQTAPITPTTSQSTPSTPPAAPPTAAPKARVGWADGVYYGWGTSRHGDIQAEVEIKGGRITSAIIAQCLTRYSCSWIAALPAQVVARQSPDVDYVSGATQSTNAFYYAVVDALLKAK